MSRTRSTHRLLALAAAAAVLAGGLVSAAPATAAAPASNCGRPAVPAEKVSIQLYSYLGWQSAVGMETVLTNLEQIGFKNVEPFGNPGATSFSSFEGKSAAQFKTQLDAHHIASPSRHGSTTEASFGAVLSDAQTLGQKFVGSGSFASGNFSTYQNTLNIAAEMNRLGKRSVATGIGKFFGHNHSNEFTTKYADPDSGEMKSVWEIIVENTDPRWVTTELDVYWAARAGVNVADLITKYSDRIDLLHVKDGKLGTPSAQFTDVGEGDIVWAPILEAAAPNVDLYVLERDGAPASREFAEDSFKYITCAGATFYSLPTVTANPAAPASVVLGGQVTLTATATGTPAPTQQWQSSSDKGATWQPIAGATAASYSFAAAATDAGRQFRSEFTNLAGTTYSTVTTVGAVTLHPSTTTVKLADKSISTKQKAKVVVTVAPTASKATGTVVVHYGTKTKSVKLTAKANGKVTVTLPKLKKGSYKVWAEYKGSSTQAGDKSPKVTLKVKQVKGK